MLATRDGLLRMLQGVSIWIAVSCITLGMGFSIVAEANPLGGRLVLFGATLYSAGGVVVWLLHQLIKCSPVVCPHCRKIEQVLAGTQKFVCTKCSCLVQVKGRKSGSHHVMLTVIGSPKNYKNLKENRKNYNMYA